MCKQIVALQATLDHMATSFPGAFSGYSMALTESQPCARNTSIGFEGAGEGGSNPLPKCRNLLPPSPITHSPTTRARVAALFYSQRMGGGLGVSACR